jgi:hypothetical protein
MAMIDFTIYRLPFPFSIAEAGMRLAVLEPPLPCPQPLLGHHVALLLLPLPRFTVSAGLGGWFDCPRLGGLCARVVMTLGSCVCSC